MKDLLRRRPSAAMVVAVTALVVATSGTAVAASQLVNGDHLIRKNSLSGNRLHNHTLTGLQIRLSELGTVPNAKNADELGGKPASSYLGGGGGGGRGGERGRHEWGREDRRLGQRDHGDAVHLGAVHGDDDLHRRRQRDLQRHQRKLDARTSPISTACSPTRTPRRTPAPTSTRAPTGRPGLCSRRRRSRSWRRVARR